MPSQTVDVEDSDFICEKLILCFGFQRNQLAKVLRVGYTKPVEKSSKKQNKTWVSVQAQSTVQKSQSKTISFMKHTLNNVL